MPHSFSSLREKLNKYLDKAQIETIHDAYVFANKSHEGQFRVSGEPYITHPLAVSMILADLKLDYQSILTALLHDLLEDTEVTKDELEHKYGKTVADLVDGVSKLKQFNFSNKAEAQAENLRKMMLAMVKDIRVIIIKMADRLHNMQTLGALKPEKRRRIARETLELFAPIANRLGMHYFKNEFENLGFGYLYPMRARVLKEEINKHHRIKAKLIDGIEEKINKQLLEAKIENYKLIWREKNLYSIYKKMKNKHIPFGEIMDIYAFRIEVNTVGDCYRVLGLMHAIFKPIPNKFKDYIAIPKVNSYQALHTVLIGPHGVPIEIQIRTHDMSKLAENGVASHWLYKSSDLSVTSAQLRAREWFTSLLEIQNRADNSLEFVENLKIDLFPDELFVFTPQGHIIKLLTGSTAVDFAYAVHTDIGNSCVATKIDNRLAPLSTVLENGQTVEIITAPGARPNPAWLNFVRSGKVRGSLRHYLRSQKKEDLHQLGKKMLAAELAKLDIKISNLSKLVITKLLKEYHLDSHPDSIDSLYQEIGSGVRLAVLVSKRLAELLELDINKVKNIEIDKQAISIKGTEGMAISFAKCCYPIPGDAICGIFRDKKGLEVHRDNCSQQLGFKKYQSEDSNIQLCWADDVEGYYKTKLVINVVNKRGVLAELAMIISRYNANIDNVNTKDYDGGLYTLITMLLEIKNKEHLSMVMQQIEKIKNVNKVTRE